MASSHLHALQRKCDNLDHLLHEEMLHAARDELAILRLKKQRLQVKDEMERLSEP